MTDLYRTFDIRTRRMSVPKDTYAGQVGDENSTVLHFSYDPQDFNTHGEYTPYIVFNVYGEDGVPYTYGPESTPVFNGHIFDIPWDVTSKCNGILQYQIKFLRSETTEDPEYDYVECLMSEIDKLIIRKSIMPIPPSTSSEVDPQYWAQIQKLLRTAFVTVTESDTPGGVILTFHPTSPEGEPVSIEIPDLDIHGTLHNGQSIRWVENGGDGYFEPYDPFAKNLYTGTATGDGETSTWQFEHGLDGIPYGVTVDKVTKVGDTVTKREPIMVRTDFDATYVYLYFSEPPEVGETFEIYVSENNDEGD